ncbi:MAG: tol-pal system YbgF family protein [Kofleriaceae bacterium]
MALRALVPLVLLGGIAHAQPKPAPPLPAQPPATDAAEAAYREGRRLYDLREFAQAIEKFKEAYRLRGDAAALFNIAQSYRLLGDCPNAHAYYTTFARNYPKERPEIVQQFIAELSPCAKPSAAAPSAPAAPKPAPPSPSRQPATPPTVATAAPASSQPAPSPRAVALSSSAREPGSPGRTLRISGIAVTGLGAVAVGAGIYFGFAARSKSKDLNSSSVWDPALQRDAKAADRNAKITFAVGGAALIGGAVLYYLGHRARHERSSIALIPTIDGASVVWSAGF